VWPADLVARLGGDEFAVLIEGTQTRPNAGPDVAGRILAAMQAPFHVSGREVHVHASVGIALDCGGDRSADVMLGEADLAMYHAKAEGKARYAVFSEDMGELVRYRLETEADLR
jgi:diguanylate cyclase (GGDEF)-like protein